MPRVASSIPSGNPILAQLAFVSCRAAHRLKAIDPVLACKDLPSIDCTPTHDDDSPIITPATSLAISPNRGSVTCRIKNDRIGSRVTSSRPARATRNASLCTNSWIKAKVTVGLTSYRISIECPDRIDVLTFASPASSAAEYLNAFNCFSNGLSFSLLRLSTLNSSAGPTTGALSFPFALTCPVPKTDSISAKYSYDPDDRAACFASSSAVSVALASRLRTERVPSVIPAAMCVSSGWN